MSLFSYGQNSIFTLYLCKLCTIYNYLFDNYAYKLTIGIQKSFTKHADFFNILPIIIQLKITLFFTLNINIAFIKALFDPAQKFLNKTDPVLELTFAANFVFN